VLRALPDLGRALGRVVAGRRRPARSSASCATGSARRAGGRAPPAPRGSPGPARSLAARAGRPRRPDRPLFARARAHAPDRAAQGGYIAEGYDAGLDALRATRGNARRAIAALEAKYRDETGIAALKIRHNGVLGYFIEVPAKHADR
jgi:DNA mismatch repair protein MutS